MMHWDHMLCFLSIQLCLLVIILVHILLMLDQYIPPPPTLVELFQKFLISITGVVHLHMATCQHPTQFRRWFFIITAGITIPPISLLAAAISVLQISPQYHKVIKGQPGVVQRSLDPDLISIRSLLDTGISLSSCTLLGCF